VPLGKAGGARERRPALPLPRGVPVLGVGPRMAIEDGALSEGFIADGALVGAFPGVGAAMRHQVALLAEAGPALIALEWLACKRDSGTAAEMLVGGVGAPEAKGWWWWCPPPPYCQCGCARGE
jgi:hypothetical protein